MRILFICTLTLASTGNILAADGEMLVTEITAHTSGS